MFPDMPRDNIRYDLLRSGSTEVTTNKILEKGYLEAVRHYFLSHTETELVVLDSLQRVTTVSIHGHHNPKHPEQLKEQQAGRNLNLLRI